MSRARILADYVSSGDELADKAPLAGATFTGQVTFNGPHVKLPVHANDAARLTAIPSPANGMIIYNTAEGALQQYNGDWSTIAPAPNVTALSGFLNDDTDSTLTVFGTNFTSSTIVKMFDASSGGSQIGSNATVTFNLSTKLTAVFGTGSIGVAGSTAYIEVDNAGATNRFSTAITVNADPTITHAGATGANADTTDHLGTYAGVIADLDTTTKLLLNFDRPNDSTDFEDNSNVGGNGVRLTASGHTHIDVGTEDSHIGLAGGKINNSVALFDGVGDYLEPQTTSLFDITSNTQSFTYDLWVYPTSIHTSGDSNQRFTSLISKGNVYLSFGFESDGTIKLHTYPSGHTYRETASGIMQTGQWQHLALVSNGGTLAIYYNGVSKTLNSTVLAMPDQTPGNGITVKPKIGIAATGSTEDMFEGYMDSIRISDIARWTTNFTPHTTLYNKKSGAVTIPTITLTGAATQLAADEDIEFTSVVNPTKPATKQHLTDTGIGLTLTNLTGANKHKATLTGTLASTESHSNMAVKAQVRKTLGSASYDDSTAVTFPSFTISCGTTDGDATVTHSSATTPRAGMVITGTNIPDDTTILSVTSATAFELSANATGTATSTLTFATTTTGLASGMPLTGSGISIAGPLTCALHTSSPTTVLAASTTGLVVGMQVNAFTGVPVGATIVSISTNVNFVMSAAATVIDPDAILTFNTIIASVDSSTAITLSNVSTGGAKTGQDLIFEDLARVAHVNGPAQDAFVGSDTLMTIASGAAAGPTLFKARRFVGTSANRLITGYGFRPDMLWIKNRGVTADHYMFDSLRDSGNALFPHSNAAAYTYSGSHIQAFTDDGFNLEGSSTGTNEGGNTYITWGWKAGGVPSANFKRITDGASGSETTISGSGTGADQWYGSPGVQGVWQSVNSVGKFSVTKYHSPSSTESDSGWAIPHGLGAQPDFIMCKSHTGAQWAVWHTDLSNETTKYLALDTNAAEATNSDIWHSTAPTATQVYMGHNGMSMLNGQYFSMYCWKAVAEVSAFGSYTGSNGAKTVTGVGFEPKFLLIKRRDNIDDWVIYDSFRGFGTSGSSDGKSISPNTTGAEDATFPGFTVNSDGWTMNTGHSYMNDPEVYIYAAFA